MTLTSTLSGAQLAFKAERVDIPLGRLVQHGLKATGAQSPAPPKVRPPSIDADTFSLKPVRQLALKEILRHAHSGTARVTLPFPLKEIDAKVTTIEVPDNTVVEVDVVLEAGAIVRAETLGRIVPPLRLPLGLSARGVIIDDKGDVHVDIAGLPDINLSKRDVLPNIPSTLDELLKVIPDDAPSEEAAAPADFEVSGIVVEARNVVPRSEAFDLGRAGQLSVGVGTQLDVDFAHERVVIAGRVQVDDAELNGRAFKILGLHGLVDVELGLIGPEDDRELHVHATCFGAAVGACEVRLADGSWAKIERAEVGRVHVRLTQARSGLTFQVHLEDVDAVIAEAAVVAHIGETSTTVRLGPCRVSGSARLSERHVDVDLDIEDAEVTIDWLDLDLDVLDLALGPIGAKATGHIKAGTDYGFSFTGELDVNAEVQSGVIAVDQLQAQIAPRSRLSMRVQDVGAGPTGLDVLEASGRLDLRLGSGSIPLGPRARLEFSDGAHGAILFDAISFAPGANWPRVVGNGHLVAESDPVAFEPLVDLPAGRASLDASFCIDDEEGHLVLEDLNMKLASRALEPAE